jgi:predicted Holliday junction resolvase-like endonuclease
MNIILIFSLIVTGCTSIVSLILIYKVLQLQTQYKKLLSQKKSSEVRLGHVAEKVAPFLDNFPYDPEKITFLGMPIDYISFEKDKITFIEVKSGKSRLSKKQRQIRDIVLEGKVAWDEIRIS